MKKVFFIITLVAFALVILTAVLYGPATLLFPFLFVSVFLVAFAVMALNAEIQADANPGIEQLEEPDFWLSNIYNAWMYTNDIEGWAEFATIISIIAAAIFGTMLDAIFLSTSHAPSSGIYESWLTGMFLTCTIGLNLVSLDYWAKQSKAKGPKVSTSES